MSLVLRASAVQLILHGFCRCKGQLLRRCDLDDFASAWIAAFACRAVLYLELAESVQRDFLTLGGGFGDGGEDGIDQLAGGLLLAQVQRDTRPLQTAVDTLLALTGA